MIKHNFVFALVGALLSFASVNAFAYDIVESPTLFGDWGGVRKDLAEKGVTLNLSYGGEGAHNTTGGTKIMTDYTDQWVIGGTFDSEKLGLWKGATGQITMTDRSGYNLGADAGIGNNMLIQEVYGRGQTWHLTQFWIDQKFMDGQLMWKIGRLTAGEDFAAFSCDFENLTFCGSQAGNLVGSYWLNWPDSVWATRLKWQATAETYWQLGVFQVNPNYVVDAYAQRMGWTLDFPSGTTGALIPLEFVWTPKLNGLPGSYKFGAWYNTSKVADLVDPQQFNAQYGAYINFQQQVSGTVADPGLVLFLNITQADQLTAATDRQIALGAQYYEPFRRHDDSIGFALGATNNNNRAAVIPTTGQSLIVNGNEYVGELYYSYAPIKSIWLRPNIQYIVHPGGTSLNPDSFLIGLKHQVLF